MLIPTKYDNINKSIAVIGYKITKELMKQPYNIDKLYQKIKKDVNISLDLFYDTITFLWLADIVEREKYQIFLRKKEK
ncbi:hypothetical protein SAMN04488516_1172 [Desulfonauticus submarinus]|uniref:Uncharacterized protein n=1 Tax=Desulfonauticus submarinus TaxID=206665 RepID=A0A1H0G889_9BACT|nr:ABC-three component system middle component 6 [Desulfonauticus submarinus]SDO03115.1 hypothetical protein SAMN04488516_1172 [Desulfonauticus submarinus]